MFVLSLERSDDDHADIAAAGMSVERLHYVNSLGPLALRCAGCDGGRRRRQLTVFDRVVVPALLWVESRWRPRFGQSLFAVAHTG